MLTVTGGLALITRRLDQAAALAQAAHDCARRGLPEAALRIALDLEEPMRDAGTLLQAVALIQRLHEEEGTLAARGVEEPEPMS